LEDALTDLDSPNSRGVAAGLCGAFYMCGLLSMGEWEAFLELIPAEPYENVRIDDYFKIGVSGIKINGQTLN
jgi:hypothetical protein